MILPIDVLISIEYFIVNSYFEIKRCRTTIKYMNNALSILMLYFSLEIQIDTKIYRF